jgi:hypothetical protein
VADVADVTDMADITDVADMTDEIYQLLDEQKPDEAA